MAKLKLDRELCTKFVFKSLFKNENKICIYSKINSIGDGVMIKLYISTFGQSVDWIKNGIPIEVGAALRNTGGKGLADDVGNNISADNAYWGELTGLYWIWKNCRFDKDDIIGFCHYNKKLDITNKEIIRQIKDNNIQWLALSPCAIVKHSYPKDIEVLENILKEYPPQYYLAFEKLYEHNGSSKNNINNCSNCELFYTTPEQFDKYCDFIFSVLFEVRKRIGDVDRVPYHKRYCAFLGERLLSVYLEANKLETKFYPIECNQNIIIKAVKRALRKSPIPLSKCKLLIYIRNKRMKKRKSSYL